MRILTCIIVRNYKERNDLIDTKIITCEASVIKLAGAFLMEGRWFLVSGE